MNLTKDCWGHVSVCLGSRCGGVCGDTWSQNLSSMLCKSLSCGRPVQANRDPTRRPASQQVLISSFQTTTHTRSLSQSAMVLATGRCYSDPVYVVCSGNSHHFLLLRRPLGTFLSFFTSYRCKRRHASLPIN